MIDVNTPPRRNLWLRLILVFLLFAVLGLASAYTCPWLVGLHTHQDSRDLGQLQQRVDELEKQVQALSAELNDVKSYTNQPATVSSDTGHLQSDVASLREALTALQDEVKRSGHDTTQVMQTQLNVVLAYIQLQETVMSGHSFTDELDILRTAGLNDSDVQTAVKSLEPYAHQGVATPAALYETFVALEPIATHAIERTEAKNWWERILAELKGMVSIRPLHGTTTAEGFHDVESDLIAGDMAATVKAYADLPQAAQEALRDWNTKAEARMQAEAIFHALMNHVMTHIPAPQDKP